MTGLSFLERICTRNRSASRSMRCFRRAPIQAHQLLVSVLLPTTRKGRGPPKNELHLSHAVAKHHSLNQCVHFLQLGSLGRHFPTEGPHFGPKGLDFVGLTAPHHCRHRPPPSVTLRFSAFATKMRLRRGLNMAKELLPCSGAPP